MKKPKPTVTCAICGGISNGRALASDHCHVTGYSRGKLCNNCNLLLGHAKDNIAILRKCIAYLRKWQQYHAYYKGIDPSRINGERIPLPFVSPLDSWTLAEHKRLWIAQGDMSVSPLWDGASL